MKDIELTVRPYRSDEYKDFIRAKNCLFCSQTAPSVVHHVSLSNTGWGTKPPDNQGIPVCPACHRGIENDPGWEKREAVRLAVLLLAYNAEYIEKKIGG